MKRSITDIAGVYASGMEAGIKKSGLDLAYVYVPGATATAGTFTRNRFKAAPLTVSEEHLRHGVLKAVVINSGNANAATGETGVAHARQVAKHAAQLLNLRETEVAVASTGIIGVPLPVEKVTAGLDRLLENPQKQEGAVAARAIMTTDLVSKEVFQEASIGTLNIQVAGMCKGSGMIAPNMGTMLAYLVSNVSIEQGLLQNLLRECVDESFNMISVDGDTSTNDMCLLFCTGEVVIAEGSEAFGIFRKLLRESCNQLAKMIARDGEGASKLLEVRVEGASTLAMARSTAMSVINSPLVKTAMTGADPNWGRIVAAVGKVPGSDIDPSQVSLHFGEHLVVQGGQKAFVDVNVLKKYLKQTEIQLRLNLNRGTASATAWGCDLTHGYIDINVEYS